MTEKHDEITQDKTCENCGRFPHQHLETKEGLICCIDYNAGLEPKNCKKFKDKKGLDKKSKKFWECPYTGKKGYVEEEDCHCFCCGTHKGIKAKNHSPHATQKTKIVDDCAQHPNLEDKPSVTTSKAVKCTEGTSNLSEKINPSLSKKVPDGFIFESDVKEFIRRLKEQIKSYEKGLDLHRGVFQRKNFIVLMKEFGEDIDKLAGDDLTNCKEVKNKNE